MTGRFLPRRGRVPLLLLCLLCAMPAWAETHYFCYIKSANGDPVGYYMSPVLTTPHERIEDIQTASKFSEYLSDNDYRIAAATRNIGCVSSQNAGYVRQQHAEFPTRYAGMQLVGWPGLPVPEKPKEELPSGPYIIIEEAESYVIPAEVLEAQRLADARKRAAVLARILAQQAMRDAELDAMMREANERARRRGRMQ